MFVYACFFYVYRICIDNIYVNRYIQCFQDFLGIEFLIKIEFCILVSVEFWDYVIFQIEFTWGEMLFSGFKCFFVDKIRVGFFQLRCVRVFFCLRKLFYFFCLIRRFIFGIDLSLGLNSRGFVVELGFCGFWRIKLS